MALSIVGETVSKYGMNKMPKIVKGIQLTNTNRWPEKQNR